MNKFKISTYFYVFNRNKTTEFGLSVVEFAIILPLLFLLIFGILDFSVLLYNKAIITNASREGARFGIVAQLTRKSRNEILDRVTVYTKGKLIDFGPGNNPTILTSPWEPSANPRPEAGETLEVAVTWEHTFLVIPNFEKLGLPNPFYIKARTVMVYE